MLLKYFISFQNYSKQGKKRKIYRRGEPVQLTTATTRSLIDSDEAEYSDYDDSNDPEYEDVSSLESDSDLSSSAESSSDSESDEEPSPKKKKKTSVKKRKKKHWIIL